MKLCHVWIITRQSKDACEQSWILWNVVGYKSTSEVEMTAYIRTWESCNGLAMPTSLKDFLQGNMQHTHKKFNSCLKSSILKITGFLLMLSYFMWNFHPTKKRQLVVTHHRFYRSVGRSWMLKKQSIDPFPGI